MAVVYYKSIVSRNVKNMQVGFGAYRRVFYKYYVGLSVEEKNSFLKTESKDVIPYTLDSQPIIKFIAWLTGIDPIQIHGQVGSSGGMGIVDFLEYAIKKCEEYEKNIFFFVRCKHY